MSTELIDRLVRDRRLACDEFESLLSSATPEERAYARDLAVAATRRQFGNRIYVRGLIEFSNHCRRDCLYCGLRRSNRAVERYRLSPDDILASCAQGYAAGYRTFVLQSGEDARFTDDLTTETVRRIRAAHPDCAITLSIGERSRAAYQRFFDAGADRFLLRHETATSEHFARLHPRSQTLETRMRCLADLKEIGFQSGAGFMVGSPFQTLRNLAADLAFLAEFLATLLAAKVAERGNENLKRREALLAVDDLAPFHMRARRQLLIQHHGAQEVNRGVFAAIEVLNKFAGYVFPKRFPLLVPAPDILSLEEWDLEAHFFFEYRKQRNGVGIHNIFPGTQEAAAKIIRDAVFPLTFTFFSRNNKAHSARSPRGRYA